MIDHNEHPLEKHGRDALLEFRAEIHAKQPAEAEKQGHAPVGGDAQVGIEGRNGYVEENAGQRVDEGRRQRRPRHRVDGQMEDGNEERRDDRPAADAVDAADKTDRNGIE